MRICKFHSRNLNSMKTYMLSKWKWRWVWVHWNILWSNIKITVVNKYARIIWSKVLYNSLHMQPLKVHKQAFMLLCELKCKLTTLSEELFFLKWLLNINVILEELKRMCTGNWLNGVFENRTEQHGCKHKTNKFSRFSRGGKA